MNERNNFAVVTFNLFYTRESGGEQESFFRKNLK